MDYGQLVMFVTTPDDDNKRNIDCFVGPKPLAGLPIAYRVRRKRLGKYHELSIRASRATGSETEMSKILTGKSKARLFIFEFIDCWVVTTAEDILLCLRDPEKHYIHKPNNDGRTQACYINIDNIRHLTIWRNEDRRPEVTAR